MGIDAAVVREKTCDYLQAGGCIIDGIQTDVVLSMDRPDYVTSMRQQSTWGGAIEIQAACNIWKLRIFVIDRRITGREREIEFLPCSVVETVQSIQLNWNGYHYT